MEAVLEEGDEEQGEEGEEGEEGILWEGVVELRQRKGRRLCGGDC